MNEFLTPLTEIISNHRATIYSGPEVSIMMAFGALPYA